MAIRASLPTRDEYLGRVISQHRRKPKFAATVETVVGPIADVTAGIAALPDSFDLDTSIGAQLDVVGEWIGQSRVVQIPLVSVWFSFDVINLGWDQGRWKGPYDPVSGFYTLDDDTYRALLYARIAANHWDGTAAAATDGLVRFLGTDARAFMESMDNRSVNVGIAGAIPSRINLALIAAGYVRFKPAGVPVEYIITTIPETPIFGFDAEGSYVAGWDAGAVGITVAAHLGI